MKRKNDYSTIEGFIRQTMRNPVKRSKDTDVFGGVCSCACDGREDVGIRISDKRKIIVEDKPLKNQC